MYLNNTRSPPWPKATSTPIIDTQTEEISATASSRPKWMNATMVAGSQATHSPLTEPIDTGSSVIIAWYRTFKVAATEERSAIYTSVSVVQVEASSSTSTAHVLWPSAKASTGLAIYTPYSGRTVIATSSMTPTELLLPNTSSTVNESSSAETRESTFTNLDAAISTQGSNEFTTVPTPLSSTPSATSLTSSISVSHTPAVFAIKSNGPAKLLSTTSSAKPLQTPKLNFNDIARLTATNVLVTGSIDGSGNVLFSTALSTQNIDPTVAPAPVALSTPSQSTTARTVDSGAFTTYSYWTTIFVTTTASPAGTPSVTAMPEVSTNSPSHAATSSTSLSPTPTSTPVPGFQTPSPSVSKKSTSPSEIAGIAAGISLAFIFIFAIFAFHRYQKRCKHPFQRASIAHEHEKPSFFPKRESFWQSSELLKSKWPSTSTVDENGIVWPEKVHLTGEAKWIHDMTLEWNHVDRYRRKMRGWPTTMTDIMFARDAGHGSVRNSATTLEKGMSGTALVSAESSREVLSPVGSGTGSWRGSLGSPTASRMRESGRTKMSERVDVQGNWI